MAQMMSSLGRRNRVEQGTVSDAHIVPGIPAKATLDATMANIFIADAELNLVYMNPKAERTLHMLAPEIERTFGVTLSEMLGGSIHRFHKDPARIERILHDPAFRPHDAEFTFGRVTLEAHINRIDGPAGGPVLGYVVAWEDVSERAAAKTRTQELTSRLAETVTKTEGVSSSLQTVASAMEQMSASVNEIARNGAEAAGVVGAAVTVVEAASATMSKLGEASTQINEVVNTISQIARQTNLLALNATIEAARAGDAGKGFAVVAGEVKDLSSATQTATERIGVLIENVQSLSRAASSEMSKIADIVDTVKDSQNAVAAAVEEQTVTNEEIARNLAEAAQQAGTVTADVAAFVQQGY